jgi:hypothetical protein
MDIWGCNIRVSVQFSRKISERNLVEHKRKRLQNIFRGKYTKSANSSFVTPIASLILIILYLKYTTAVENSK